MLQGYPRRFGKYHLLRPLAQGGMGALYLAVSGEGGMEKLCVLKTVLPHLSDKEYIGRFRDEAKVVVKLQHGNLVQVFDAGLNSGELYLAMEFIEGKDLRAVWNRCARKGIAFPVDVAVHIVKELCRGLEYAHTFGDLKLVHRDVSPPNVLLAYSGEVKLTDFGLASSTLKSEKTAPGLVYGKVSYMSPEQARGEPLDARTDLYTAGVLLWELLTGRQLFPQGDKQPGDLLQLVKEPHIDAPSQRASRVTPEVDRIVLRALALRREERYPDGEKMRAALAGYLAQHAPATDAARVSQFLKDLFAEDIEKERKDREALLLAVQTSLQSKTPVQGTDTSQAVTGAVGQGQRQGRAGAGAAANAEAAQEAQEEPDPKDPGGLVGQLLHDRYRVRRMIGEGGMGRVYEAEHVEIGKRVALKILHPVYSRTPEVVERFRREARAASKIGHENIVDVTDSGTTPDGSVYFVMEFLEGVDLAKVIEAEGALPIDRALAIASQLCRALAAAHAVGIIHRDLKPENVFLIAREGGVDFVKVLDFGIAKSTELEEARDKRLTHPGIAMGTPEYMAPEQATGRPYDLRIDIYSTGAILYEMVCGAAPYQGDNFMEVLTKKATQGPTPPRNHRPDLPEALERIILQTLASDPAARPQTMEALDYEITKLLAGRGAAVGKMLGLPAALVAEGRPPTGPFVQGAGGRYGRGGRAIREDRDDPDETLVDFSSPARLRMRRLRWAGAVVAAGALAGLGWMVAHRSQVLSAGPPSAWGSSAPVRVPVPAAAAAAPRGKLEPASAAAEAAPPLAPLPAASSTVQTLADEHRGASKRQLLEARRLLAGGHYAAAQRAFSHLLETHERGAALVGLGEAAFEQASYREAVRLGARALMTGETVPARLLLGKSYYKLGQLGEAESEFKRVLAAQPSNPEALRGLATAQRMQAK